MEKSRAPPMYVLHCSVEEHEPRRSLGATFIGVRSPEVIDGCLFPSIGWGSVVTSGG
jgi:hypothetical protein